MGLRRSGLAQPQRVTSKGGDQSVVRFGAYGYVVDASFTSQTVFYRSSHEHIACTGSVDVINRSPDRHRSSPSAVASIRHGDIGHCEQYAAMQLAQTAQVLLGNRQCNNRGSRTGFTKLNT